MADTARTSILLVDDTDLVRDSMKVFLEAYGYSVSVAKDGCEALTLLERGLRPDLILLDLMMPVMDGFEFRKQQMQRSDLSDIPVVVYSGHYDPCLRMQELRAAAYVQKPISPHTLLHLVEVHRLRP